MKKFITFPITATESRPVDIQNILFLRVTGATIELYQKTGAKKCVLTFSGSVTASDAQVLMTRIYDTMAQASQESWTNVIYPISLDKINGGSLDLVSIAII